jgi:two-component system sensor histidine kinase BaeS
VFTVASSLRLGFGAPHLGGLAIGLAFALLALFRFGGRRFRRFASTAGDVMTAVERIEHGDYSARVPEPWQAPRDMRALVEAINSMAQRLQADERQRQALLADVGHELRTPLAVIRGEVEAMVDGVHPADEAHLTMVLDEVEVLSRLVDDLRTLMLSEGGTLALHREPTDLAIVAAECIGALRPAAQRVGVTLDLQTDDDVPLGDLDPVRMRQVISNLVDNAVRHTPAGGSVTVAVEARNGSLQLDVRDTGEGIGPELLPRVFERFVKGKGSPGSGLGLAIARSLVEAHGGTISVESAPGQGATFRVVIPRTDRN